MTAAKVKMKHAQGNKALIKILIDGYNLIFECGLHGKSVNTNSLALARERLLRTVQSNYAGQEPEIAVVFDAKKQMLSGQQERESWRGIQVYFSIHHDDADELIEQLIQQHSAPKLLTVVSSDHRLHKAAARRKARAIDSGVWWDQQAAKEHPVELPKSPSEAYAQPLLSEAELDLMQQDVDNQIDGDQIDDESDDWPDV